MQTCREQGRCIRQFYTKMNQNWNEFKKGMRDGIPIALGYFAVAFSLGIMAKKIGMSSVQGFISSILNHASAGEFAQFRVIADNAPYWTMAVVIFVTNARYMLMSCALSQKFAPKSSLLHRILVGFGITDEIFGISIARPGYLNPYYAYGAILLSLPAWASGTAIGIAAGNILPAGIVSALSVALYGMFLSIIIPPARKSRVILGLVSISFGISFAVSEISWFEHISDSMKTIILTVVISAAAAVLFPVKDENTKKE